MVLAAAAVMARLGEWQLDRARQKGEQDRIRAAQTQPPVALSSLLAPRTAFPESAADRRVIVQGTWDGRRQLLVPGRRLGDATGLWVLTPLRLPDGSGVPIVRGWVPDAGNTAADPARLPAGTVDVTGVLQPTEDVTDLAPGEAGGVPAGQVALAAAPLLVQHWPYPLVTGYVVQTAAAPGAGRPRRRRCRRARAAGWRCRISPTPCSGGCSPPSGSSSGGGSCATTTTAGSRPGATSTNRTDGGPP